MAEFEPQRAQSSTRPARRSTLGVPQSQAPQSQAPQTHSRVLRFLAVASWAAIALLGYAALRDASSLHDHGRRAIEAGGGFFIGAFVPESLHPEPQARAVRLAAAIISAAAFYQLAPWSWLW